LRRELREQAVFEEEVFATSGSDRLKMIGLAHRPMGPGNRISRKDQLPVTWFDVGASAISVVCKQH
jgi:hypothetical protein